MKAVIMESLGIPAQELAQLEAPFAEKGVIFEHFDRTSDGKTLISEAKGADAMILANMPMPEEVIRSCPALKFIDIAFTGVDHVGLGAAKERGIAVSNASGYSSEAVSELVLGMVLAKARNIRAVEDRCRTGGTKDGLVDWEIKGKTIGIIGLGKIGSRTAQLFHALDATILASTRSFHKDVPDYITQVDRDELLRRSDIVVLHCPLNDSTRGMIGERQLAEMKPTAILVNAARGPVVNEKELATALENGVIAGACLDVFEKEPPLATDAEILKAPNTLVTPHVAFATKESMTLRARIVFDNLKAWMDGQPINVIL